MITRRLLCAALLVVTLGGCQALYKTVKPNWAEANMLAGSQKVLFEVAHLSLDKAGFPVGVGAEPAASTLTSNWYLSESPFRAKGFRERATLEYEPGKEEGTFVVRCRVHRELNMSARPLSPEHREWKQVEDNVQRANHVLQYMRIYLGADQFDVGPPRSDFRD